MTSQFNISVKIKIKNIKIFFSKTLKAKFKILNQILILKFKNYDIQN